MFTCSLIRQQQQAVDAGASLVHAHYTLTALQPTAGGGAPDSSTGSDSSSSGGGSSGGGSTIFTDSLWFSPPGNILPGEGSMAGQLAEAFYGLLRLASATPRKPRGSSALLTCPAVLCAPTLQASSIRPASPLVCSTCCCARHPPLRRQLKRRRRRGRRRPDSNQQQRQQQQGKDQRAPLAGT